MSYAICNKCGGILWGSPTTSDSRTCSCSGGSYQVWISPNTFWNNPIKERDEARAWARKLYRQAQDLSVLLDCALDNQVLWKNYAKERYEKIQEQAAYIERLEAAFRLAALPHQNKCPCLGNEGDPAFVCTCGVTEACKLRDELRARGK